MARRRGDKRRADSTSKRIWVIALGLVALVAAVLIWPRSRTPAEPPPAPQQAPSPPPPVAKHEPLIAPGPTSDPTPQAPPEPSAPSADVPMDRASFNARKAAMTKVALENIQQQINYPLWSSALTEDMQYKPREPYHTMSAGPGDSFPKLEIYPEKLRYALGEPIRIVAIARGESGPIRFDALTGRTGAIKRTRPEMNLDWVEQPDLSYVATLDVPADTARQNRGEWAVFVDSQIEAQHRVATTEFSIVVTDAQITGPFRMALEDGSLSVYVAINATAPGRQHLRGELWSTSDAPVAYSWVRNADTPVGTSTMKLVFYGKTIRDSGVAGPYRVKNLILTTYDANADPYENPPVDPDLVTPAWPLTAFTDTPVNGNNAALLARQKVLEDELSKAERNGYDPNHYELPPAVPPTRGDPPQQ